MCLSRVHWAHCPLFCPSYCSWGESFSSSFITFSFLEEERFRQRNLWAPLPSELGYALISFMMDDNEKLNLGVLIEWKRNKWSRSYRGSSDTEPDTEAMPWGVPGHFLTRIERIQLAWKSPRTTQQLPAGFIKPCYRVAWWQRGTGGIKHVQSILYELTSYHPIPLHTV